MRHIEKNISGLLRVTCLVLALSGCASSGALVEEKLDPGSSVTVLRAVVPLVLYRDSSARAAFARDYVYVAPVEVNRMGSHSYYLWFGIWSTMRADKPASGQRDGFDTAVLFVDGEPLPLELAGWTDDSIGVTEPVHVKPAAGGADAYYRVTLDQVRKLAMAREIELLIGSGPPRTYLPWGDTDASRASLREFVASSYR